MLDTRPTVGKITAGTYDADVQAQLNGGLAVPRAVRHCPHDIRGWEPDCIISHPPSRRIMVVEFTRGMSDKAADMEDRDALKSQKYHSTLVYLKALYPSWEVMYFTFVIGVLTSYPEQDWAQKLTQIGLSEWQQEDLCKEAVRTCIEAGHRLANARRSALATLEGGGRGDRQGIG